MARSQRTPFNKKRLIAEDIIKNERKNRAVFIVEILGDYSLVFRKFWGLKTEFHLMMPK
jgi:hypothetical protein